eukprot:m.423488 g.423488  ORF g.423488 m.423488 type:complete len:251 (-) comp56660_c0_seq1:50-802(-)
MHITGSEGGAPAKVGVAITDVCTGLFAHAAIASALFAREATGEGQHIDCSMLHIQLASLVNIASNYLVAGKEASRMGTAHSSIVPYQAFASSDGYVVVGALNDTQFVSLCKRLNQPALEQDERFKTNPLRVKHRQILIKALQDIFQTQTTASWLAVLDGSGIPYAPVNNMQQAFADEHVVATGTVQSVNHPTVGELRLVTPAIKYSGTPTQPMVAPPLLNQHAEYVLKTVLNYSTEHISDLTKQGAFGSA